MNSYGIITTDRASLEIYEAYAYLEGKRLGLGREFLLELEAVTSLLVYYPLLGNMVKSPYRKMKTSRFEYNVLYKFEAETVVIFRVVHSGSDPSHWFRFP